MPPVGSTALVPDLRCAPSGMTKGALVRDDTDYGINTFTSVFLPYKPPLVEDTMARIDYVTHGDLWQDEAIKSAARRAACHMVKVRARFYGRRPAALDALHSGLSMASATTLVAIAEHLVEREQRSPRRWFGFGGEVALLNARGALLLGRARRRAERHDL